MCPSSCSVIVLVLIVAHANGINYAGLLQECMTRHFRGPCHPWANELFSGWALDKFAISRQHRVMYQMIPKAGSSTTRQVFADNYGYLGDDGRKWRMNAGTNNPISNVIVARDEKAAAARAKLEQERPRKDTAGAKIAAVGNFSNFFKFTFVVDPIRHVVAAHQMIVRNATTKTLERHILITRAQLLHQPNNFTTKQLIGNGDIHFAPQIWLLKRVAQMGLVLDYVAHMDQSGYAGLKKEIGARGLLPPTTRQSRHRQTRHQLVPTRKSIMMLCELLWQEYECLGFDLPMECAGLSRGQRLLDIPGLNVC